MDAHRGFYRSGKHKIVFDDLIKEGKYAGKNAIYTIEKNGDVTFTDGSKVGEVLAGGVVNCHRTAPYLTLVANGDVVMDDEVIGHIDDASDVTIDGVSIGKAPGIDKQVAAYIYYGILFDKQGIGKVRAAISQERQRQEQERQAEEARLMAEQQAEAATMTTVTTTTTPSSKKSSTASTSTSKVQEWKIEKGSSKGYVDANGVVYNWSHKKIGQLPKGNGNIKDGNGTTIGRINMGDIYDRSGKKVATVTSGGSISVPGSNATVAEVKGAGRIDRKKDGKTLGYCNARPYAWAVAIIYCDFFKF